MEIFPRAWTCFIEQMKCDENSKNATEWSQVPLSVTCNDILDIFRKYPSFLRRPKSEGFGLGK